MNCDETFNAGIHYVTDAYKRVCKFNRELHADLEKYRAENMELRKLAQRMRRYMVDAVEHCGYDAQTTGYTMLGSRLEECEEAMRELGVEVD